MEKVILTSEKDTQQLAEHVASQLKGGEIIALIGDLGAGKTTFTQYLAKALGVKEHVNSPTFVIAREYETDKHPLHTLIHVDAYRLSAVEELYDLGLDQHISETHSVVIIEWADKIEDFLKQYENVKRLEFKLEGGERTVILSE